MKISLLLILSSFFLYAEQQHVELKSITAIEKEYQRLLPLFQQERRQFSKFSQTDAYWQGEHGKAIIKLGPAIIPFLIQEVRRGDFFFHVPLRQITRIQIDPEHKSESEQEKSKLWIRWWEAKTKKMENKSQ